MEQSTRSPEKCYVNRVTPLSTALACILFVTLPILTLYIGFRKGVDEGPHIPAETLQKIAFATSVYFDPAKNGTRADEQKIQSPDGLSVAEATADGKILIYGAGGVEPLVIDALQGSTTIPGFTTVDYAKKEGDFYGRKVYYHGWIAFVADDRVLYPVRGGYVIRDIARNTESRIDGDVVYVYGGKYLVYTTNPSGIKDTEVHYTLYDIDAGKGVKFHPEAEVDGRDLGRFNVCSGKLMFIQYPQGWNKVVDPGYAHYYNFDIASAKLTEMEKTNDYQRVAELQDAISSCR